MAYDMGICKSLGVSNYLKKHLEELQLFRSFFATRHVPLNVCCECILVGGLFLRSGCE